MPIYSARHALTNPLTADLPETEFEELNCVIGLAGDTDETTFDAAKQYMLRLEVRLQVLFLMLLIRPLPIYHPIKKLPEYISWYRNDDIKKFLGC